MFTCYFLVPWLLQRGVSTYYNTMKQFHCRLPSLFLILLLVSSRPAFAGKELPIQNWHKISYPEVNYGMGEQAKIVRKGEYLTKAANCISCHTNTKGLAFAGGLPIETPFGIVYSSNITPDKTTGIGNWTDKQFIHAMKHGVAPNGSYYFPAFPYNYFTKLSDTDTLAIKAYLAAVPAIHNPIHEPELRWPYRWRFLQAVWRLFYFQPGELLPNPHASAKWNRGAYIVQGLGHCGLCHTPMNSFGAPKNKYALTGGFASGFYAPNISAEALHSVAVENIINVFLKDKSIVSGEIQGPMLAVNHNSLRYLSKDDLTSMILYLKTVESKLPKNIPIINNSTATDMKTKVQLMRQGERVYLESCAICHKPDGTGMPPVYPALKGDATATGPVAATIEIVLYGRPGTAMQGFAAQLSDADIAAVVTYVRNAWGNHEAGTQAASLIQSKDIAAARRK